MAIRLPRDANGHVIPLDTTLMYRNDNNQFHVTDFFYEAKPDKWFARSGSECVEVSRLHLDTYEKDSCDNGFKCSVCGCTVEDEEHYHVSGTWNFCPKCGKRVWTIKNE